EKERGITITLGFTSFLTKSGDEISIVDVPGHEKFIKTMISGAAGMDMIMLVIAADDGIMPQTREHLDICTLLGVKGGLIVLTKTDIVEEEWLELVEADIKKFVRGSFLETAPILKVSSVTNAGIDELKSEIESMAATVIVEEAAGLARMPVDRIFTMKGFGTVVTGTLLSGEIDVGDEIVLLPSGKSAKVRSLQQHGSIAEKAKARGRVAVNLASFDKDESIRGELLVKKGAFSSSPIIDAYIMNISSENIAIKNMSKIRFVAHTNRAMAEIRLITGKKLSPGESGYAQIRLDKPLPLVSDDRFILLGTSKIQTLGGGIVLNPKAKLLPIRKQGALLDELEHLKATPLIARAEIFIKKAGTHGISLTELSSLINLKEKKIKKSLSKELNKGSILLYDSEHQSFVSGEGLSQAKARLLSIIEEFHEVNPAKPGIMKEELRGKALSIMPDKLFSYTLKVLAKEEGVIIKSDIVLAKAFSESVSEFSKELRGEIEKIYLDGVLMPPFLPELKKRLSAHKPVYIDDTLNALIRDSVLVRISEGYYLHESIFEGLKAKLFSYFKEHESIDLSGFKAMTNASRKYTVPLLEKFDMLGITVRQSDNSRRACRSQT
ncbi:selenocysteine-specific translation elongation factor, partial [Thermodesulfobacteriota bacterium]